jgi:predicted metal-dependent hydrolase
MPKAAPTHELDLLGETISYEIRHSEDATKPRIDVDIHGVRVILPTDSDEHPETLLSENAAWVVEKKRKYDAYREQVPDRSFKEGAVFPYLDEPYQVVVEQRSASDVLDGELKLAEHHVEQTSIERALERLYRRQARTHFEEQADHYATEMNVEYAEIEIRNQRTKWGSCSTNGTLGLNWRLMMAPPRVIDYIIIHELAHLQEPNHTDEFWNLVAEHDPEYQDHAEWLEENSTQLIFTEDDI